MTTALTRYRPEVGTPAMAAAKPNSAAHGKQPPAAPGASLTLFTIPKPFAGHIGVIQRNAIKSWTRLTPRCDIVLCGNEAGTSETAAELNLRHLPDLARNEFGTPFLHSAFQQVRLMSATERLCYINADIMLLDDFTKAVVQINLDRFLLIGRRTDLDLAQEWNFEQPDWRKRLREAVKERGVPHSMWGIDYFVFPRHGVLDRLPPFVVGRPGWDNWVIYEARKRGVPVIDASAMISAIHQNHDYGHVPMRSGEKWVGPEAQRQVRLMHDLMDGNTIRFAIVDATHALTTQGLTRRIGLRSLRRQWETLPALYPRLKPLVAMFDPLVRVADWLWQHRPRRHKRAANAGRPSPLTAPACGAAR